MSQESGKTSIFVSYSHRDSDMLEELKLHLKSLLRRSGRLDLWDDTRIAAGARWREEISASIENARIAILLVSKHFLASDFIMNNELPPLLRHASERGVRLIPLIVSPCDFEASELSGFQATNNPKSTLREISETERDRLFVGLTREFGKIIEQGLERADDWRVMGSKPSADSINDLLDPSNAKEIVSNRAIYLPDLVRNTVRPVIRNRTFLNCKLFGPALLYLQRDFTAEHCNFLGGAEMESHFIPISNPTNIPYVGIIGCENIVLRGCEIIGVAFIDTPQRIRAMITKFKEGMSES